MSYLTEHYNNLPEEIKKQFSFDDIKNFVFNGPTTPPILKEYLEKNLCMPLRYILMGRQMVVGFGARTEKEIESALEKEVFGKIIELTKRADEYLLAKLGEESAKAYN